MQGKLLQSWWKITGTDCGTCWMKWLRWKKRLVNAHTNTHTHIEMRTRLRRSSIPCAFFFLIDHSYWRSECWKAESINKRKSFLKRERLKGREDPGCICTYVCVGVCVCWVHAFMCHLHISFLSLPLWSDFVHTVSLSFSTHVSCPPSRLIELSR